MIPLSIPELGGNEWKYIKDCLDTNWVSSVGSYVDMFEESVADFTSSERAVATSSGTTALHISLLLAGVKPGDRVIVPNLTFVAPLNAITYVGASPILIDADPDNWQMDLGLLEKYLDEETDMKKGICTTRDAAPISAILPVHVLGNMCDMERLMQIASKYSLKLIEDATEALGSKQGDKHAGTFGDFGCFSFNGNKIITTGGGGMLVTNNAEAAQKAKHLTTQAKSDEVEYIHDSIGYNYRLVNILAAMGLAQMEQLPGFLDRKKEIAEAYDNAFEGIEAQQQQVQEDIKANNWLYTIKVPNKTDLMRHLNEREIEARALWVPMNELPMFTSAKYISNDQHAKALYQACLSLPCSSGLSNEQQQAVISAVLEFYSV